MPIRTIDSHSIKMQLIERSDASVYLLLNPEILRLHSLEKNQQRYEGMVESDRPIDYLDEIDPYTKKEWLWDDTLLENFSETGPVLIETDKDSKIIDAFLDEWSNHPTGILILSSAQPETLLTQLRYRVMIGLPDGSEARFNISNPDVLTGVFTSLSAHRVDELLGPIEDLFWSIRMNNSNGTQSIDWSRATNAHVSQVVTEQPFIFSSNEVHSMDDYFDKKEEDTLQASKEALG